jgi:hypothetical protein
VCLFVYLHREVGFFIRTHIKKSLKNVNKKGTCKFNINIFIIITGSIPLLVDYLFSSQCLYTDMVIRVRMKNTSSR